MLYNMLNDVTTHLSINEQIRWCAWRGHMHAYAALQDI